MVEKGETLLRKFGFILYLCARKLAENMLVKLTIKELELRKGGENQDLSMYSELPKRTFVRKEKPPYGLTVFKVKI